MKHIRKYIFGMVLLSVQVLWAQEQNTFTLQQAIEYGLEHNFEIKNAQTDVNIAKKKVVETRAIGLPHINASVGYDYFVDIPTQLMPDFITPNLIRVNQQFFGLQPVVPISGEQRMMEMRFGRPHNLTAGISATQLIFNGSYLVGLRAASTYVNFARVSLEKKKKEIKHKIAKAYYPVIILQENLALMDSMLVNMQEMLDETKALQEEGFMEDTDVDQLNIVLNDLKTSRKNLQNKWDISSKNLKFLMGMPIETPVYLTEDLENIVNDVASVSLEASKYDYGKHQDYQLLQVSKSLALLDIKNKKAALLPVLSAYYNYQEKAMRDEFDFFDSEQDWFPTQIVGAKLQIPIFQSWQTRAQIQQKKLALEKVKVREEQLKQALQLKYESAKSNLAYSIDVFYNKELKVKQAERVYRRTKVKFQTGTASSFELTQAFNQYLQAQMEYLNAMMDLLVSKENYELETGE